MTQQWKLPIKLIVRDVEVVECVAFVRARSLAALRRNNLLQREISTTRNEIVGRDSFPCCVFTTGNQCPSYSKTNKRRYVNKSSLIIWLNRGIRFNCLRTKIEHQLNQFKLEIARGHPPFLPVTLMVEPEFTLSARKGNNWRQFTFLPITQLRPKLFNKCTTNLRCYSLPVFILKLLMQLRTTVEPRLTTNSIINATTSLIRPLSFVQK